MVTPAAASRPGLASDRFRSSTLDRLVNSGPMMTGIDAFAIWSGTSVYEVLTRLGPRCHRRYQKL